MSLSPGKYYLDIPKRRLENLAYRAKLLEKASKSRALQQDLYKACSEDIFFYINSFGWQFNPNAIGESPCRVGPFITWDFQDEAVSIILNSIEKRKDLLIEKSRDMGASWLCLFIMEWLWHFRPWQKFLCISRSENSVEDDDPDSLFWKIDFIHTHLPDWLMPEGKRENLKRRKLYYGNLANGSTITGQASTGKAGVGGRATAMFIDEFSQIKEDYEVYQRTSDTSQCRIFNGTHKGEGTCFHELSLSEVSPIKKLVMHWSQHPDKRKGLYRFDQIANRVEVLDKTFDYQAYDPDFDFALTPAPAGGPFPGIRSPWYDAECIRRRNPRGIAMDLDIDPGGSAAQFFNPLTIRHLKSLYCCPPYWEGDIEIDHDTGRPIKLVKKEAGPLKLWTIPVNDTVLASGVYTAGADISTGVGSTNSCFAALNAATGEKVLEYATCTVTPENFAPICVALCLLLKDNHGEPAYFAWEHQGPGIAFGEKILTLGFRRIYWRRAHPTLAGGKPSRQPGWYPSNDSKRLLLDDYRAALENRSYINRSEFSLKECLPYRYTSQGNVEHPSDTNSEDPTGARVNHGDRVIADALSWMMAKDLGTISRVKEKEAEVILGTLAWRRRLAEPITREKW